MIYDKLPSIFLTTVASEKNGSTNQLIASYILEHIEELDEMGISELAERNHVSNSSISRFVKDVGLNDFVELKELIHSTRLEFQGISSEQLISDYTGHVINSLKMVQDSLDMHKIHCLVQDLRKYSKVATFGLLKSSGVAVNFQSDLLMLGKSVYTNISFNEQVQYLSACNENNLLIIFSYTGSYFDAVELRRLKKQLKLPKIWMISAKRSEYPEFVDEVITFDSLQDQLSHPYSLQLVEGIIVQFYNMERIL